MLPDLQSIYEALKGASVLEILRETLCLHEERDAGDCGH